MTQSVRPTAESNASEIRVEQRHADLVTVYVTGEIDISIGPHLASSLSSAAELVRAPGALVVDLTAVPFLDSSALGELLSASRRLASRDITFRVVIPADAPTRRVVELVGLVGVLNVTEPDANVTEPDANVTEPDANVTEPDALTT